MTFRQLSQHDALCDVNTGKSDTKRSIQVLCNSMLKDIKQSNLRIAMPNSNLCLKCFPGLKTSDMVYYAKPSMPNNLTYLYCISVLTIYSQSNAQLILLMRSSM